MNIGLGFETSGFLSVIGNLTFGTGAILNVNWDDSLLAATDGWSFDYHFFNAANIFGLENLTIVTHGFENHQGFTWFASDGILTVSYTDGTATVPEPATLVMLGLAAVGIPVVRRFRKR